MNNFLGLVCGALLIVAALAGMLALARWLAKAPADERPQSHPLALHAVNAGGRAWLATQPAVPLAHVGYAAQGAPAPAVVPAPPAQPAAPRQRLQLASPRAVVAASVGEWVVYRADDLADYATSPDADADRSSLN